MIGIGMVLGVALVVVGSDSIQFVLNIIGLIESLPTQTQSYLNYTNSNHDWSDDNGVYQHRCNPLPKSCVTHLLYFGLLFLLK
jgi:hypothetical protein